MTLNSSRPSNTRNLREADPLEEFDRDFSSWELNVVPMGQRRNLIISHGDQAIWVDRDLYVKNPEFVTASLMTRIRNTGMTPGPEKDWFADMVAEISLDRPASRPS